MPKKKTTKKRKVSYLIFYGTHRNYDLAYRHALQLLRDHKAELVKIERRNSQGRFSKRGKNFTFYLLPSEDKELNREYMVTIDYKQHKRGFNADLYIVSNASATPTELADQARKQLPSGKKFIANWIEGGYATVSKGNFTEDKPLTRIRAFNRHKK